MGKVKHYAPAGIIGNMTAFCNRFEVYENVTFNRDKVTCKKCIAKLTVKRYDNFYNMNQD